MAEKKVLEGEFFHEIEEMEGKKFEHIGFRDKEGKFGDVMLSFVPNIGDKKKVRLTIEVLED